MVRALLSSEYSTMVWEICRVQITVKCICETPLSLPWSDNYSHHVEQPPINFPKKVCPAVKSFFLEKKSSPYFRRWETPRLIFAQIFQDTIQPTISIFAISNKSTREMKNFIVLLIDSFHLPQGNWVTSKRQFTFDN